MDSLYSTARSFIDTEEWDSAIFHGKRCLVGATETENTTLKINSYFLIAYAENQKKEFGNSLIHYLQASEIAEFSSDPKHKKTLAMLYQNISDILFKYKHYELTHTYLSKAQRLAEGEGDTALFLSISHNKINLLIDEDKDDEAETLIKKLLEHPGLYPKLRNQLINNLGRIKHDEGFYDDARELYNKILSGQDFPFSQKPLACHNIGMAYYDQGKYNEAIPYFKRTIVMCNSSYDNHWLFNSYRHLGLSYFILKNYNNAEENFLSAISLLNLSRVRIESYEVFKDLSELYEVLGNENQALKYKNLYVKKLEEHLKEQEEMLIQDKKYNMQLLTERYFENLKAREIERKATILSRNTIIISSALLILIAIGFYYRQRKTKRDIIRALTDIELHSKV